MSTIDTNQNRGGRILKQTDIRADESTIDVVLDAKGRLQLSSLIRTIDNFEDINHQDLRKLDYWDTFPDILDLSVGELYWSEKRTIVYTGVDNGMFERGKYYRCAKTADGEYIWQKINQVDLVPLYPYDTVQQSNNTLYFTPTSCCFFFGKLPATETEFTFNMNLDNLQDFQYYGNNDIVFNASVETKITFVATKDGRTFPVTVAHGNGDNVTVTGVYKATVEVVPDSRVVVTMHALSGATAAKKEDAGYCYGFRYNLDSSVPAVTRIELRRYTDENGQPAEEIVQVGNYTSMPCHEFRRCLVKKDATGKMAAGYPKYLFKTNSLYLEDGKTPADLTGMDGDVCVEIPKCYLRITVPDPLSGAGVDTDPVTGQLYTGYLDYLISDKPIPDPPKDASGNYTYCEKMIFNGVHPLFRVGGEYELDDNGNVQYEQTYDYKTNTFIDTEIALRKAADKCYAAAFASVRCANYYADATDNKVWHFGPMRITSLHATATDCNGDNDFIDCTTYKTDQGQDAPIYFDDRDADYPCLTPGTAIGVRTNGNNTSNNNDVYRDNKAINGTYTNAQARSVAPYRDGAMVGVNLPGVRVVVMSPLSKYPVLMPGGCDTIFGCTVETTVAGKNSYEANSAYTYTASMNFVQPDNSVVTKDYRIYRNDSGNIVLSDGETPIATSTETVAEETTFNFSDLHWEFNNTEDTTKGVQISMTTTPYKCTIGPTNYGNRAPNFDWANQSYWDDALGGNPNWALNYRPLVSQSRAAFQYMHYNTASGVGIADQDFAMRYLEIEKLHNDFIKHDWDFPNSDYKCTFRFDKALPRANCLTANDTTNKWFAMVDDTNVTHFMHFEYDTESTHQAGETADLNNHWVLVKFDKRTETLFDVEEHYYCINKHYAGSDSDERFVRIQMKYAVGDRAMSSGVDTYYTTEDGSTFTAIATGTVLTANKIYYVRCDNNGAQATNGAYYYQVPIHEGKMLADTWYKKTILAKTDNNYESHTEGSTISPECHYIDPYRRYLRLGDIGYRPIDTFGPITGNFAISNEPVEQSGETPIATNKPGIEFGNWLCQDTNIIETNREWTFTDTYGIVYKVAFDHGPMRWKIYRHDSDWTPIYEARRIDPTQFKLQNARTSSNAFCVARSFARAATPDTQAKSAIALGMLPDVTSGDGTISLTYRYYGDVVTTSGSGKIVKPYLDRKWYNTSSKVQLEYVRKGSTTPAFANGEPVSYKYGGCWCVIKYTDSNFTTADTVLSSDMDFIIPGVVSTVNVSSDKLMMKHYTCLFQPLNPEARDAQRSYNAATGETTNNSMVYKYTMGAAGGVTTISKPLTSIDGNNNMYGIFVDENGNLPAYLLNLYKDNKYMINGIRAFADGHRVIKYGTSSADTNNDDEYSFKELCESATYYRYLNVAVGNVVTDSVQLNTFTGDATPPESKFDRKWTVTVGTQTHRIEYIKPEDGRLLPTGATVGSIYGDKWVVVVYNTIIGSDYTDEIDYVNHGDMYGCWMILRYVPGTTVNLDRLPSPTTVGTSGILNNTITNGQTMVTPQCYTSFGYDTPGRPKAFNLIPPNNANQLFMAIEGALDSDGLKLENNERVLKFDNLNNIVVKKKSMRAYNCHTRLKQFMALMMVIDGGTFDTQSGISTGKSWLASFNYAKSTFSGRTAPLGNITGEILWDPDTDINISYDDWAAAAQSDTSKQVVAFNWRGFENPFGNIGEYEDGIIPCTRFIDGHETTGYWEVIDPNAYSDTMKLYNTWKQNLTYGGYNANNFNVTDVTAVYATYTASPAYTWHLHNFPASGWIKRWDPVTFLPTIVGGSSTTYCCGFFQPPSNFFESPTHIPEWIPQMLSYLYIVREYHFNSVSEDWPCGLLNINTYSRISDGKGTRLQF